jgi:uncharacterized DUF497 family protein
VDHVTWDPEKDRLNQAKHGISFAEAAPVLRHRLLRRWPDLEHSHDQPRTISMGLTPAGQILVIVTAVAMDGSIRIISARRATKRERHAYQDD